MSIENCISDIKKEVLNIEKYKFFVRWLFKKTLCIHLHNIIKTYPISTKINSNVYYLNNNFLSYRSGSYAFYNKNL